MNNKLLSVLCAGAVLMSAGFANAFEGKGNEQLPPPPRHELDHPRGMPKFDKEMHKKMADKFAKELGLTDEQKAQAEKIREEGRKKMEPLMKEMDGLHKKMDALREENMKEFEKILTAEQKDKLSQIKQKHDKKRHGDFRRMRKEGHPQGPDFEPKD